MKSGCLRQSRIVRSSIVLSRTSCRLDFPRLRNRNQSHIPTRREYVLKQTAVFGCFKYRQFDRQIQILLCKSFRFDDLYHAVHIFLADLV